MVGTSPAAEPEAAYLAEVAASVVYFPLYSGEPRLPGTVQVRRETPTAVLGENTVQALRTGGGDYPVDGVFLLRDAMAPTPLVPGLAGGGGPRGGGAPLGPPPPRRVCRGAAGRAGGRSI